MGLCRALQLHYREAESSSPASSASTVLERTSAFPPPTSYGTTPTAGLFKLPQPGPRYPTEHSSMEEGEQLRAGTFKVQELKTSQPLGYGGTAC